jgi:predicted nucleic acid-binding Zn ribbon protein
MEKQPQQPAHIREVLQAVLKRYRPEAEAGMLRIWQVWDLVVGEEMARNARPAAFKGSILLVHVTSPAWIHHLQFQRKEIIARLNTRLGVSMVSELKFKVGAF